MATLDAHRRYTALFSEAPPVLDPSRLPAVPGAVTGGAIRGTGFSGEAFCRFGWLLLVSLVEHASFAAGAVSWARVCASGQHRRLASTSAVDPPSERNPGGVGTAAGGGVVDGGSGTPSPESETLAPSPATPSASKAYMAIVYPLFFRLLAAFVMIWDRQVAILNTIEVLVATMQFVALSAVLERSVPDQSPGRGKGVAAGAVLAGFAAKMSARAALSYCQSESDPRDLSLL